MSRPQFSLVSKGCSKIRTSKSRQFGIHGQTAFSLFLKIVVILRSIHALKDETSGDNKIAAPDALGNGDGRC